MDKVYSLRAASTAYQLNKVRGRTKLIKLKYPHKSVDSDEKIKICMKKIR